MTTDIVICPKCNGAGVVESYALSNFETHIDCSMCKGSGRVKKITNIKYEPYLGLNKKGNEIE